MAGFINGRCAILSGLTASFSSVRKLEAGREVVQRFLKYQSGIIKSLSNVATESKTQVLWLKDLLCDGHKCITRIGDVYIYRDSGHLSIEGSIALLGKLIISEDYDVKN